MTDLDKIASGLAAAHRHTGQRVSADSLKNLTREQALIVQAKVLTILGEAVPVAKVAITSDGISNGAPIPASLVISDGQTVTLSARDLAGLEIEVAAHLSADLTPEIAAGGNDAIRKAIDYFTIGIELIGSRIDDRGKAGAFGPLADFIVTGGYVLGSDHISEQPDVGGLPVTLWVDGEVMQRENAQYPFTDALTPIRAFAAGGGHGFSGLRKGMVVTTGSLSPLLMAPRAGEISVQLGNFTPVTFKLG